MASKSVLYILMHRKLLVCLFFLATTSLWAQTRAMPQGPDLLKVIPPAPTAGDARDTLDRSIFRATRSLKDSERWKLAHRDNRYGLQDLMNDFHCATAVDLDIAKHPQLKALLDMVNSENAASGYLKDHYKRKRPFLVDAGEICIERDEDLVGSWDYPSGHATLSWAVALILSELFPSHATAIMARARAYGESRIICGVHNASAVEAGRTLGAAIFAALQATPAFQKGLDGAKKELALVPGSAFNTATCAAETKVLSISPYQYPGKR